MGRGHKWDEDTNSDSEGDNKRKIKYLKLKEPTKKQVEDISQNDTF